MQANFNVTPTELIEISNKLETVGSDFLMQVKNMYTSLDDLMAKWQGQGAGEYYKSILNRKADVEALGKVIRQYSVFLANAGSTYRSTDADIASSATRF